MQPFHCAAKSALFCSVLRVSEGTGILEPGKMIFTVAVPACVLLIQSGLVGGDPQKQFFSEVSAAVGQRVVLPCQSTIEDSDSNLNFFWYRHLPGETLTFLLQAFKASGNDKFRNGRFSVVVYENKTAPLQIATVSFQDTAIYYCAVKHGVIIETFIFVCGIQLTVHSDVTPSPSVYKLISKDDEDLEMCLITDYSPGKLKGTDKQTSAVVEVTTSESKPEASYLSTYWAKKDKMWCGANHEGFGELEAEDPESGASTVCVTGISLHFRTDENLNMLSLSHLSLKIILMKVIIFNVLMTMLMRKKKNESNQMVQS